MNRDKLAGTGNWYILFVKTGYEEKIVTILNEKLDSGRSKAFSPRKETIFRRKGVDNINLEILFPGYVFIETTKTYTELSKEMQYFAGSLKGVYRFLYYTDKDEAALHENEKREIISMCGGGDYCLRNSVGIIEGDNVRILSGALMGREVAIRKINRHKRQAVIEMMIFGEVREIVVALEITDVRKN